MASDGHVADEAAGADDRQHHLEVIFGDDDIHRRKSSFVSPDTPRLAHRHEREPSNAACIVHSLLGQPTVTRSDGDGGREEDVGVGVGAEGEGKDMDKDQNKDEGGYEKTIQDEGPRVFHDRKTQTDHGKVDGERQGEGEGEENGGDDGDASRPASPVVQSRLLTKKQLSDMAWNVRALSKKLGSLKLRLNVKSVFIVTKPHDDCIVRLARDLALWLLNPDRDAHYTVYVESRLEMDGEFDAPNICNGHPSARKRLKYWDYDLVTQKPHLADFIITLGGDGTVLYASWLFQRVVPPVLSFSLGSLGFLTKFDFGDYKSTLSRAFLEGVTVSLRLRFECTVMRSRLRPTIDKRFSARDLVDELVGDEESEDHITHTPHKMFQILNEIVVDRGPNPTMSSLEIFGDDEYFTSVQADGVCVATPTGSTAYNLAAGGSLSHPENPVILLTAICAHTLNFRPIILPDSIVLRVGVPYDARTSSWASFDGRERIELHPGDYVTISASRFPFANVVPAGHRSHEWIQSISRTLNWNTRQKQQKDPSSAKHCEEKQGDQVS